MKPHEIRKAFIQFFKDKDHTLVPSAGLLPTGDPTLLFTNAGMVQFKKLWSGEVTLPYRRAVSVQKCLRASDLERVGKNARHNTFFEMLGNFSFGDYFKQEAIDWAWEFITETVALSQDKLYVTVFDEDDEAFDMWKKKVEESKIFKLGKEDNFWGPAGGRGACGPCSEIYYDFGEDVGCGKPTCQPGCDCDRYAEIWNLVFPQYDAQVDGTLKPLKNRGIDTGMGFERFCMAVQGKKSLFELSLFKPIIEEAEKISGLQYESSKVTLSVIADHVRALTFAIAEGIYPSNVGRGYLLRHLVRRAQSLAYELDVKKPFLHQLVGVVADIMKDQYPELIERREGVALVIKSEEESFLRTLGKGISVFNDFVSSMKSKIIPGETVFKLYDTYGFPPDLTYELGRREGLESDSSGFEKIMESQKQRARAASKFEARKEEWNEFPGPQTTEFVGYENLKSTSKIVKWRKTGETYEVILDRTPFYAESGGQAGDQGIMRNENLELHVLDTRDVAGLWIHIVTLKKGKINQNELTCEVDGSRRKAIQRNHTGTHLLHTALQKVVGDWVHQEGSLVEPERFRFDFTHFNPLNPDEINRIETLVNGWILENIKVESSEKSLEEAVKQGAMALFGEKYGDKVRVIRVKDISMELCGGTHVGSTGEIGILTIVSESGIHAGVRRVEVVTGSYAMQRLKRFENDLTSISAKLGTPLLDAKQKVDDLVESESTLRTRLTRLEQTQILTLAPDILKKKVTANGVDILISQVDTDDIDNLRVLADKLRSGKKRAGVLGTVIGDKPAFITFVSDDLTQTIKASQLAREIGKLAGGGGGGKDTLGQAGGKDPSKLGLVLEKARELIGDLAKS
jgi:alanyl-tRNA synthetase